MATRSRGGTLVACFLATAVVAGGCVVARQSRAAASVSARSVPASHQSNHFVPARKWAWVPVAGAFAYRVAFFHAGRRVLLGRSKAPRYVMPRSFRYHRGRYHWTVRALPAASAHNPIVNSMFVLTRATARAANRR